MAIDLVASALTVEDHTPNGSGLISDPLPANHAALATAKTRSSCAPDRALKVTLPASDTLRLKSLSSTCGPFASASPAAILSSPVCKRASRSQNQHSFRNVPAFAAVLRPL